MCCLQTNLYICLHTNLVRVSQRNFNRAGTHFRIFFSLTLFHGNSIKNYTHTRRCGFIFQFNIHFSSTPQEFRAVYNATAKILLFPITLYIFVVFSGSYYYYLCEYVTSTEMRFIIPQQWTLPYLYFVGKCQIIFSAHILNVLFYASAMRQRSVVSTVG